MVYRDMTFCGSSDQCDNKKCIRHWSHIPDGWLGQVSMSFFFDCKQRVDKVCYTNSKEKEKGKGKC